MGKVKESCLNTFPKGYVEKVINEFESESPNHCGPYYGSGVYGIYVYDLRINEKRRLLYIGSSRNISQRLSLRSHHYLRAYARFNDPYAVISVSMPCSDYINREKILIAHYKPFLNIVGKNG